MSNTVKFSANAEQKSLRSGNFYIGTGDVDKGPTNITGFYNGITPSYNGYTVYVDKATQGPSIHVCNNDNELIYLTNTKFNQSFTTVQECFQYYNSQTDKTVVNKEYENIITDGLVLNLDAGFIPSYPRTGSIWNDLSVNNNNGTLFNVPIYSELNNGCLIFDGIDESCSIPFNSNTMDFSLAQTIIMWLRPGVNSNTARRNPYSQAYGGPGTITHEISRGFTYFFGTHGGNNTPYVGISSNFTVSSNELAFIAVTRHQPSNICRWYKNGVMTQNTNAGNYSATANGSSNIQIAAGYVNRFIGDIYMVLVYNKFFTSTDILKTYDTTKGRFGL